MNARLLIAFLSLLIVAVAPIGLVVHAAYPSLTIQGNVLDKTYNFEVTPPLLIDVKFSNLQPNGGVDNLGLSFKDNNSQEIFVLYVKTNGDLVLHVPIAGVTTDQVLGSWQSIGEIKIRYWDDKLEILDANGNQLYEIDNSFPPIEYVWAHSSNTSYAAFSSGSITISGEDDPSVITKQTSDMINAFMPMFATMVAIGFMVGILNKMTSIFEGMFKL